MLKRKGDRLIVRCVGYPTKIDGKEGHFAICIDLNLYTFRPTQQEAIKSLNEAIHGYLESVGELVKEGEDIRHLVPRPASFFPHRLMYHIAALRSALSRPNRESTLFTRLVEMPA